MHEFSESYNCQTGSALYCLRLGFGVPAEGHVRPAQALLRVTSVSWRPMMIES